MASVGKEDMVRLLVEPIPMDLFTFLIYLSDFFFFRILSERVFVALQTDGHFGHAGKGLVFKMGMTGDAFDTLFLVFLMIEGEWLSSPGAYPEANEDEE
jgi:hypothetical protein